jgi:DNA-binding transcriptional LysR family regulator
MNLRQLRTFVAIADSGGIVRAATRLNMTQPTASRQISGLEAELGVPLFDRIGRGVHLTAEGEDLLRHSRRVLAEIDSLRERARALKAGQTGTLRVGTTPQAIESLLVDFLPHFRKAHPGVDVDLVEDGGVRLPGRLERGDVHLTIMPEGEERFHARVLYPVCMLAVLAKTHRLSRNSLVDVSELAQEPLLLTARGFASRDWFLSACQVARVRPRVVLESGAPQSLIALAGGGHGIAVIPSSVLVRAAKARAIPLVHRNETIGRWTVIAWDPERFLAPFAANFVDELVAYTRETYPNRELLQRAPPLPRPKRSVSPR